MNEKRKELVQNFIAKLKDEIQELRIYYGHLLEDKVKDEKVCWLNLIKLDMVEEFFCNEEFYGWMNSYGNYIISDHLLDLLCIRELSTAQDLMDSIYLYTPFTNQKEFAFNLLIPLEYGLLQDKLKEAQNER